MSVVTPGDKKPKPNGMKKNKLNEEFVRKVVRRYLAEMGPRNPITMDDVMSGGAIGDAGDPFADPSMTDFSQEKELCTNCAEEMYCPDHDPANLGGDCPDCAMGNCPEHDTLYEGEMPAGLKAYMDKKKGKKSDDDGDDDKDGDKKDNKKSSGGSKPDYLDLDKDGDKDEPMKDAAKDKKNESKIYIPENRSMYDLHDQRLFENLKKWAVKK